MGMAMEGGACEHDMNVVSTVVDRHGCQGAGGVVFVVLCKFLILLHFDGCGAVASNLLFDREYIVR